MVGLPFVHELVTADPQGRDMPGDTPSRRSVREQKARRRSRLLAGGTAAALLLAAGGYLLLRGEDGPDSACGGGTALTIAVSPELSEVVEKTLDEVTDDGGCGDYSVSSMSAADVAAAINEDRAPDVWVPDSSTWTDAVDPEKTSGQWIAGQSIAKSPVVLAAGSTGKQAKTTVSSWGALLNTSGSMRMANPDVDTASRLAYHASRSGQPASIGLTTGRQLIFMSRFAAPSLSKLMADYAAKPGEALPFPASEQAIASWNEENDDKPALRAVMPTKGTLTLDYPWIINPTLTGDQLKVAEEARTAFGSLKVRDRLSEAGFRTADGRGGPEVAGAEPAELEELKPLSRNERLGAVEQWDLLRTDLRMLAVIDVSGSMAWPSTTPGMSRYDVTKGALTRGVGIIPAGSEVGGWLFSSGQGNGRDYRVMAPVRRLDAEVGGKTQRELLTELIGSSDKFVKGDTALYDTVWAAYQEMQKTYDDKYVNSVVVMTDGENDDPNGGLSLRQLTAKLDAAYDPERPVRIITIGMGEANPAALQAIADETGGNSHIAETPEDINRVFVSALLARHK